MLAELMAQIHVCLNPFLQEFLHVAACLSQDCKFPDFIYIFDLQHDKTNKVTCAPSKDSDQSLGSVLYG